MPRFRKQCPDCGDKIHVRKLKCPCGHVFFRKPKLILNSENALKSQEDRKKTIVACQTRKIALASEQQSEKRRKADSAHHADQRAHETQQESEKHRQVDSAHHAHKRALETPEQSKRHRTADRIGTTNYRHHKRCNVSLQHGIDSFLAKTKQGPDYVCTSCHRLMYKQSVTPLNVHKYTKASSALLADVLGPECLYTSFDGNQWICNTCNAALTRGNMPTQAVANGLRLSNVPHV